MEDGEEEEDFDEGDDDGEGDDEGEKEGEKVGDIDDEVDDDEGEEKIDIEVEGNFFLILIFLILQQGKLNKKIHTISRKKSQQFSIYKFY